jgi:hypothetical protein
MISKGQVVKSIGFALVGAAPGLIMWAVKGGMQGLVLCGLGAFIGFAFSLPGVSAKRVAGLTAGVMVAHNVPAPLRDRVFDHFTGETAEHPPASTPPGEAETISLHESNETME